MGLLDQVSGSSPLTKALLVMLAAKAATSYFGKDEAKAAESGAGGAPAPSPGAASGTIESGILAGLPSLDAVIDKLRSSGLGDQVDSWVGKGDNKQVAPQELDKALGPNTVDELAKESGLPKDSLLKQLSDVLPQVVDKLTPDGKLPDGR